MKIENVRIITFTQKELEIIIPLANELEENGIDTNEISLNDLSTMYYCDSDITIETAKQGKIILTPKLD